MSRGLAEFARMYLANKAGFPLLVTTPVLLWESTEALNPADEQWNQTESGIKGRADKPRPGEPVVFELKKDPKKKNPFAMGVTLGRVETNDVVIDDASISRFHAWFQQDPKSSGWLVVDAESKNGSMLNAVKLKPNAKTPLVDGARVRFGEIELLFMLPAGLVRRIEDAFK